MNSSLVTTGITPLTIGSTETFQCQPYLNGLPWTVTSARLILQDQNGNQTTITATVTSSGILAGWTVTTAGTWTRCWRLQDANGIVQYSRPIVFTVAASP